MESRGNTAMKCVIYSRVSTTHQTVENQIEELRAAALRMGWIVVKELRDEGISGAKGRSDRPAFDQLHKMIARREVDVVMAWSIDRLGRSLKDLSTFIEEVQSVGVNLYIHNNGINTATPAGKLIFNIFSSLAEWEREIIRERTLAGIARARKEGHTLGRPTRVNDGTPQAVKMLRAQGMGKVKIAKTLRIGVGTVDKVIKLAA